MPLKKLTKLRSVFSLKEAAEYLTIQLEESVSVSDVLRMVLDRQLIASWLISGIKPLLKGHWTNEAADQDNLVLTTQFGKLSFDCTPLKLEGVFQLPLVGNEAGWMKTQYISHASKDYLSEPPKADVPNVIMSRGEEVFLLLEPFHSVFDINQLDELSLEQRVNIKNPKLSFCEFSSNSPV